MPPMDPASLSEKSADYRSRTRADHRTVGRHRKSQGSRTAPARRSCALHAAEKVGKPVSMFAVSGKHPYDVILQAAQKLRSSRLFIDQSSRVSRDFQEQSLLAALERLEPPRPTVVIEIVPKNGRRANSSEAFGTSCRIALVAFDRFRTRYPIAGDTGQSKRESRRFR